MITNTQIKKIKTLQRICGLDDDVYRDILRNQAGINSCKDLRSNRQIDSVMRHLGRLAEKVDKKANQKAPDWKWENTVEGKELIERSQKVASRIDRASFSQLRYVWGLWWSLRHEWRKTNEQCMESTLNHFLENGRAGAKVKVAKWQWLNQDMTNHLISVLKGRVAQVNKSKKKNARKPESVS